MRIQREPLAVRVTRQLVDCIQQGEWTDWLPSESVLAKELGVSRTTVRQALKRLREDGLIETQRGMNSRVSGDFKARSGVRRSQSNVVSLLSPIPFGRIRQHTLLWIDELRSLLHEANLSLNFYASQSFSRRDPQTEVQKLIRQYRSRSWILLWSNRDLQRAFAQTGTPALVVGATRPDIPLNSASVDNQAIAFHAFGQFTSQGHRSIGLVCPSKPTFGHRIIRDKFLETGKAKGSGAINVQVITFDEQDKDKFKRQLLRSRNQKTPLTAFFFIQPLHLLTAYNTFQGAGLSIPGDVSLVSAFADQSFEFLSPEPTHYRMDPLVFAKKVFHLLEKLDRGIISPVDSFQLVPDWVEGASIGPVADG